MDADLVRSAQGGDEGAFAQMVEATAGRFVAVAQRILHDPVLAEEATQQALVRIWRYLPGLRDRERRCRPFLHGVWRRHGRARAGP